ncbi:MAG: PIN domain-containing protein [Thiobacillaceae bacterium]
MRAFLDANVLVYLFDADTPDKQEQASALLQADVARGRAVLSTQVLQEFYVAVTRKLARPLDALTAEAALRCLAELPVTPVDSALVLRAAQRSRTDKLSFWDSLIVETALQSGTKVLYSEDLRTAGLSRACRS